MFAVGAAAAAGAVPNNVDPIALKVQKAREFRNKVFSLNADGMPLLGPIRNLFSDNEKLIADQINGVFNHRKAELIANNARNPNIIDTSGTGDVSGNAHRPLTGAPADIGSTMVLAAKQSVFGPATTRRLLEVAASASTLDPHDEPCIEVWEGYTKEIWTRDPVSREYKIDLVDKKLLNGFSNASGSFGILIDTLEGRPQLIHVDLLKRLYNPGDAPYDDVMDSFEPRRKHLWRLRDFLAVCVYSQLPCRNFMYSCAEHSQNYYLVESVCWGVTAGVGNASGNVASVGARLGDNWICYAPVGFASLFTQLCMGATNPPSDVFQVVDPATGNPVANGEYFYLELKLWGGTDAVSLKQRNAISGPSASDEALYLGAHCCNQLDKTEYMQNFRSAAAGQAVSGSVIAGCSSLLVARMAAVASISRMERLRMLAPSGWKNCTEVQPPFNDATVVIARNGPAINDDVEITGGDQFFDRMFASDDTSPLDLDIFRLTVLMKERPTNYFSHSQFKQFVKKILERLERDGDGQGNGHELQFEVVRVDGTELRYRGLPAEYKEYLLTPYVKERLESWDQPAQAAAAPANGN